jgi:hypothetical protein
MKEADKYVKSVQYHVIRALQVKTPRETTTCLSEWQKFKTLTMSLSTMM